ncbi:siderophore-iron reductase FhuF [Neorhizobium sp. JUb45]|uniref:siderophore-iron reductase FhuF n=1 Tax=unclassified Neorhizobium TaxID=2629175 RepID=UPI0010D6A23C|nr:siderophore-iron reductase FhuF [Neorhizobium sp. JUb45]TCQ98173.1 ferric iron reductase protein FhuF [Neorhizobium sp. JUb45]
MIPELAHIFKGPFAALGETLSVNPAPNITIDAFFTCGQLHETLDIFSRRWSAPDPRVVATQWSKTYFSTLLPAVLLPAMLCNWHLPLGTDTMGLQLSPTCAVAGFVFSSPGGRCDISRGTPRLFDFLVEGHLRPVVEMLTAATPLPAKVLWSNAGNVFETVVGRASAMLGNDHPAVQEGMEIMADRRDATGRANPLFQPVRYIDNGNERIRQRRICCLRYFTPELGYCKSCPKPDI